MKTFTEQATKFVQESETRNLENMTQRIQTLEAIARKLEKKARGKREGGCGCFQCRKKYNIALENLNDARAEYKDEFNRMYKGDLSQGE